jgi:23S rRNA G2445 N2-methylase RlmL
VQRTSEYLIECDVLEGLEDLAAEEIEARLQPDQRVEFVRAGAIRFGWAGDLREVLALRSVVAAYVLLQFAVPRPKALLGHQYFTALTQTATAILALQPTKAFRTIRLSAAGENSSVLTRLREELAARLGLVPATEEGDLLLRLRRVGDGWEALLRMTPRPLATRAWRVQNVPGAPNATLACAIARLTEPYADDRVLNICCGSGTLLIERLLLMPAQQVIGCDMNPVVLGYARENMHAAGLAGRARLECWDATGLPLDNASVDVIVADLPFGQLVGSHAENERLYPQLLAEAGRVAQPGTRMVLLTHELRLLEETAAQYPHLWQPRGVVRVHSGGMTPGIFLFERV